MAEQVELLLHEAAYARMVDRLAAMDAVRPLLMRRDGSLARADGGPADDAAPRAAYGSVDIFVDVGPQFVALTTTAAPLEWLQTASAGLDFDLFGTLARRGVKITTSTATASGIAEYVLAGVLDHFQRGAARRCAQAAHRWERIFYRDVAGTRWLIVGFGAIGQAVAARARAFGAHITGVRRSGGTHDLADAIVTPDRMAEHLPAADVIVLALPLSPENARMVDARFLAALEPGRTVLVNVARGGHVDEAALIEGLAAERPVAAVLDVFATEPLPADSPFWDHPHVSLSAHAAPWGDGLLPRGDAEMLDNLRRFIAGEPLANAATLSEIESALAASPRSIASVPGAQAEE